MKRITIRFANPRVAFGSSTVSADDPEWDGPCHTGPAVALSFPRAPFRVRVPARGATAVAHTGAVLLPRPDTEYRRERVGAGGEASDWLWVERGLLEEHLGDLERLWASRRWYGALDGPALLGARRLARTRDAGADPAATEAAAYELLPAVARALGALTPRDSASPPRRKPPHRAVDDAIEYLVEHRREPFDLARLAHAVGLTPAHLCVVFKAATGRTLSRYLRELRLCASLDRLDAPSTTHARLARDLGFASPSHFAARFKAHFGLTPTQAGRELAGASKP